MKKFITSFLVTILSVKAFAVTYISPPAPRFMIIKQSGIYRLPPEAVYLQVRACGGSGGGGVVALGNMYGGSSGQFVSGQTPMPSGSSLNVTIGAAGAKATAAGNGGNGGNTIVNFINPNNVTLFQNVANGGLGGRGLIPQTAQSNELVPTATNGTTTRATTPYCDNKGGTTATTTGAATDGEAGMVFVSW